MGVESHTITVRTLREGELVNVTDRVQSIVDKAKLSNGMASLFIPGSTAALTTIEHEPGLLIDFPAALDRLVPKTLTYQHEHHWHDGNGHSHVRAALIGPDLIVPFTHRKLLLGTWQQIVLVELDVRPRERNIIVQLIGD